MRYKLIAIDIDGTLTNSQKKITERTKKALINLQKQGVKVCLASGRPTQGVSPLADELALKKYGGYILSFNGAYIFECETGKVVYQNVLPKDAPQLICPLAKENNCEILSYENDIIITETPKNQYVQIEAGINKMQIKAVPSLMEYINFPVTKFLILQEGDYLAKVEKRLADTIGDRYSVYRSEPYFLEIMPLNVDKAYSLNHLAEYLHIKKNEVAACGDGYNDITMLQYAGLGVAMKNARDIVKHTADFITLSNDEDGIVYAVEKMLAGVI